MLMDHPCNVSKATKLLCTRQEVAQINSVNFRKLKTPVHAYEALDGFEIRREEYQQLSQYTARDFDGTLVACKDHRLQPSVLLRGGMLVILQVNIDIKGGLVNGSQGIICGFEEFDIGKVMEAKNSGKDIFSYPLFSGEHASLKQRQLTEFMRAQQKASPLSQQQPAKRFWPRVLFHNGRKCTIYASCVINSIGNEEPYSLLHRTQIPLTAGWAMSVHKSQGMTLDRVIVDLSRSFVEGQVYVALSRATNLEGLKIEGDEKGLKISCGGNRDVQRFLRDNFSCYSEVGSAEVDLSNTSQYY